MRRRTQAILLLSIGAALAHISLTGDLYLRYVKEGLRPLLIAAAAVLILLGLVGTVRDVLGIDRPGRTFRGAAKAAASDGNPDTQDHDPANGPRIAWLLFLPAASLLFFAPPALGSYTASKDSNQAAVERAGIRKLPVVAGPIAMSMADFTGRYMWDEMDTLKGRPVRLTGFVTPGKDQTWYLSRLVVTCCAADAKVLKVRIAGPLPPPTDAWVTVTGIWQPTKRSGSVLTDTPMLSATKVQRIPEPKDPYRDTPPPPTR